MKKTVLIGLAGISLLMSACSEPETQATEVVEAPPAVETEPAVADSGDVVSAEKAVQAFKDNGLPVGQVIVYDEKTDPNNLLNRPNQYTQKVAFADTSIDQPDPEFLMDDASPINGGTIEVYPTVDGAIKRKEYVEQVTESMPMLQQYIYVNDTAVLRLEHDVLPSDAEKYNEIFQKQ